MKSEANTLKQRKKPEEIRELSRAKNWISWLNKWERTWVIASITLCTFTILHMPVIKGDEPADLLARLRTRAEVCLTFTAVFFVLSTALTYRITRSDADNTPILPLLSAATIVFAGMVIELAGLVLLAEALRHLKA